MVRKLNIFLFISILFIAIPLYASQKVEVESLKGGIAETDVDVSTTAVALPTTAFKGRKTIIIYNNSSNTIYLGGENVTTSSGLPMLPRAKAYADVTDAIVLYGIAAGGTNDIRIIELR